MRKAKSRGTSIKRGRVISFTIYPRPKTKAILVKAAKTAKRNVSQFVILEALKNIAQDEGKSLSELLPEDEYQALVFNKFPKRKKMK